MASFTISGIITEPDDITPWRGNYFIGLYSSTGIAIDGDGSWRAGENKLPTNPSTGFASIALPQTSGDELYILRFESFRGETKGPWTFALTGNLTWGDIIDNPNPLPPLPSLASLLADIAEEAATRAAADDALGDAITALADSGQSHLAQDVDGVPYFDLTYPGGLRVLVDTDGTPYYLTGA